MVFEVDKLVAAADIRSNDFKLAVSVNLGFVFFKMQIAFSRRSDSVSHNSIDVRQAHVIKSYSKVIYLFYHARVDFWSSKIFEKGNQVTHIHAVRIRVHSTFSPRS